MMPPDGRQAGWGRPSRRRRVTRLIWRPRSRCGQGFSALPMTNTCWWAWCTISPPTAGRSPRWCVIWVWRMPAGAPGRPRAGLNCRCSMSITRCGSARSSAISTTATARIAAQLAYWQDALAGMPERLQLPTDRPYPPVADQRGASVAVDWPAELQQRVREVAARAQRDQLHGGSGRPGGAAVQDQRQQLMWRWVSRSPGAVIPRSMSWSGSSSTRWCCGSIWLGIPPFTELLAQVRRRSLAAFEHQDVPFEVLVERLNPTRSLTHHPLVQVMLAWQNLPGHDTEPRRRIGVG